MYDTYGHAGLSGSNMGADFNSSVFQDFHDIFGEFFGFEDLFGGGRRRTRGERSAASDLRYDMTLTFEEAAAGVTTKVKLPKQELCEACNGTGAKKGTGATTCQTCGRARADGLSAGIFHHYAHVSGVPGRGADYSRALLGVPRSWPRGARKND